MSQDTEAALPPYFNISPDAALASSDPGSALPISPPSPRAAPGAATTWSPAATGARKAAACGFSPPGKSPAT